MYVLAEMIGVEVKNNAVLQDIDVQRLYEHYCVHPDTTDLIFVALLGPESGMSDFVARTLDALDE